MTIPSHARRPFTMLEMVVVLLVISVIMGMAASYFSTALQTESLDSHREKLQELVTACRRKALRSGQEQHVFYDSTERAWIWQEEERRLPVPNEIMVLDPVSDQEAEYADTSSAFVFHPDGTAKPFQVEIRDRESSLHLKCAPFTGSLEQARSEDAIRPLWEKGE